MVEDGKNESGYSTCATADILTISPGWFAPSLLTSTCSVPSPEMGSQTEEIKTYCYGCWNRPLKVPGGRPAVPVRAVQAEQVREQRHWGDAGRRRESLAATSAAQCQQIFVCYHQISDGWLQFKQENNFTYVLNYSLLASYFSMKLKQFTSFLMDYRRNSSIILLPLYDQYL